VLARKPAPRGWLDQVQYVMLPCELASWQRAKRLNEVPSGALAHARAQRCTTFTPHVTADSFENRPYIVN
jgi:hypothetical protein